MFSVYFLQKRRGKWRENTKTEKKLKRLRRKQRLNVKRREQAFLEKINQSFSPQEISQFIHTNNSVPQSFALMLLSKIKALESRIETLQNKDKRSLICHASSQTQDLSIDNDITCNKSCRIWLRRKERFYNLQLGKIQRFWKNLLLSETDRSALLVREGCKRIQNYALDDFRKSFPDLFLR